MTEKTETSTLSTSELTYRNKEVTKSYSKVVEASKLLLKPFSAAKYRTIIEIDHTKSDQETNLISEAITCFFNITLTNNKMGYAMIYFKGDEEAIHRFGARLYNRLLRQLFKNTSLPVVEDSVRVNNPGRVEPFFVNRLTSGVKQNVKISTISQD